MPIPQHGNSSVANGSTQAGERPHGTASCLSMEFLMHGQVPVLL